MEFFIILHDKRHTIERKTPPRSKFLQHQLAQSVSLSATEFLHDQDTLVVIVEG